MTTPKTAAGVTLKAPFKLRALLATMKSAKEKSVNMNIWDRDIDAVEDAIATIEVLRAMPQFRSDVQTNDGKASRNEALRMLADLFSESAHETWSRDEIVNIIEDAIGLGSSPVTSADRGGEA
jgi:hypothetical protein